jgi:hypothetical protein
MRIDIKAVNKTPVGIIDSADKSNIYIKKLVICVENSLYQVGYLPANGVNGKLRRIMTEILLTKALAKGIKLTAADFSLMSNGGGVNQQKKNTVNTDNKQKDSDKDKKVKKEKSRNKKPKCIKDLVEIRKLNPIISLFGAGLSISGKIAINNFIPTTDIIKSQVSFVTKDYDIKKPSYIQSMNISHMDDLRNVSELATKVFTIDELQSYQEELAKNKKDNKTSVQMLIAKEYIVPGITMYSSIMQLPDRYQIEEYEYGLLLKSLEIFAKSRIGSTQKNWGVMNYDMFIDGDYDNPFLRSESDENYVFNITIKPSFKNEQQKAISEADKWLDAISPENINIEKYLKTSSDFSSDEEEDESES